MKIEIHNLGPIHHFEFDLEKDLHLIYGANSVGKSYAVYCLYNTLKHLYSNQENITELAEIKLSDFPQITDNAILRKFEKSNKRKVDIKNELIPYCKEWLQAILDNKITASFFNTYSSLKNKRNSNKFKIEFRAKSFDFSFTIDDEKKELLILSLNLKKPFIIAIENIIYNEKDCRKIIYFEREIERSSWTYEQQQHFSPSLAYKALNTISSNIRWLLEHIYFLPASRSGLYQTLNGFGQIFAEISKYKNQVNGGFEIPSLLEPISEYYLTLSNIERKRKNLDLAAIVSKLETLIGGQVSIDEKNKKIYFAPNNLDITIDISEAASMVAELAPLVLFLKHLEINPSDGAFPHSDVIFPQKTLIFIEEPEAHLHPEVQVKLMEIFAALAKHNIKVVMTTHSDYMFNKLGNLLLAKEIEAEKVGVYHMVMTDKGSIVSPETTLSQEGITDNNFTPVAEKLYEERIALYDRLNEETDVTPTN